MHIVIFVDQTLGKLHDFQFKDRSLCNEKPIQDFLDVHTKAVSRSEISLDPLIGYFDRLPGGILNAIRNEVLKNALFYTLLLR